MKKMTIKRWYPKYSAWKRLKIWYSYQHSGLGKRISLPAYLYYGMERMTREQRKEIILDSELKRYDEAFNAESHRYIFNSKREFYQVFGGYMKRGIFFPKEQGEEEFYAFVHKYPRFITKPDDQYGGKGLERHEISGNSLQERIFLKTLYEELKKKNYLAEEWLSPQEAYAIVYGEAFNTVRINTLVLKSGEIKIFAAANQFGSRGSITDNDEIYGIWAAVDMDTGKVFRVEKDDETAVLYDIHPDTGIPILGFQNPNWEEIKKLAKELAGIVPKCRWIGWDIGVLPDGTIELIEGNITPEIGIWQAMTGIGLRSFFEAEM